MKPAVLLFALLLALPFLAAPAPRVLDGARLDGPYGLWVGIDDDSVRVGWITRKPGPGFLEVLDGNRRVFEGVTPADSVHLLSFRRRGGSVVLRYGGRDDAQDRHETEVDLDAGRQRADVSLRAVDSLFIVGDIHGEWETMLATFRNAGLIDAAHHWSGGRAHLAVLGDMMSRGEDVTRVLWFLHGLERQARAAGGRVHIVLGNHELMVMLGDLRYVQPKETRLAELRGTTYSNLYDPRTTLLGRWLSSKPGMVRIGDVLVAHGGVSAEYLDYSVQSYDDTLAAYVGQELFAVWDDTTAVVQMDSVTFGRIVDFFWGENSVFWYRGYVQQPDSTAVALQAVLQQFRSRVHVVGHTPGPTIRTLHDGQLIAVNTDKFAAEVLLLVRGRNGTARYRIGTEGPPEPL